MESLKSHYLAMARYNRWMNEKLYALCGTLSDEERKKDLGAFFGNLHRTLNHLLVTDRAWMKRITRDAKYDLKDKDGKPLPFQYVSDDHFSDFGELSRERKQTDSDILALIESFTPGQIEGTLTYKTAKGDSFTHPLWWALSHWFNHQTHHRGQATTLLMQLGKDPGVTDLVVMLRSGG